MDPSQMMPRSFPMWPPPPPSAASDAMPPPPLPQPFLAPPQPQPQPNRGWKRKNNPKNNLAGGGAYQPPAIGDLQVQNRAKARRWFNNNNTNPNNAGRKYFFPKSNSNKAAAGSKAKAPRNTTSFIIRAKRAGGIASLVSPCPVTPAVLPTPRISPSREGLSDMAQQQWGVDGYGSMKGLIRLRASSPRHPGEGDGEDDDSSSGSDVEEHVEVERRLDHDLSRFEMVYPGGMGNGGYVFEDLDDEYDQDVHVARLEEENLTLKERLFLMEQEVGDMRRRLEAIEARFAGTDGAAAGSADNAGVVLQPEQRSNAADAENPVVENGVDAAAVAGDAVIESLENANANAAGAENTNVVVEGDAASASDDTVEDALKNDTEMDVAASASDDTVEDALKNDTEMDVAASASANKVEDALKNDTEMDVAASASANTVADALKNDTEMGDATADADNLVEEALENVKEVGIVVPGADNAVEESRGGKDDMNKGDVGQEKGAAAGLEKNAEMTDTGNGEDKGEDGKQA